MGPVECQCFMQILLAWDWLHSCWRFYFSAFTQICSATTCLCQSCFLCHVCLYLKVFQSFFPPLFLWMLFIAALLWLYNSLKVRWEIVPGWGEVRQRRWGSGGDEREQGEREEIRAVTSKPTSAFRNVTLPKLFQECGESAFWMETRCQTEKIHTENLDKDRKRGRLRCKVEEGLVCHELHAWIQEVDAAGPAKPLRPAVWTQARIRNSGEQLAKHAAWL